MLNILDRILTSASVTDEEGKSYPIHSHTSPAQLKFLDEIITTKNFSKGLEIGLAYGISTLQILESLSKVTHDFSHVVMDPYQQEWNNIGKLNIVRSGFEKNVRFFELPSDQVLPQLVNESQPFDFVYIDSTKVFELLIVDVHYITKLLEIGGVLVLDDCDYPGIRLLSRFLCKHPSFRKYGSLNKDAHSLKGKLAAMITNWFIKAIPFRNRYGSRIDISTDEELGVNYKCIAFEKIANDNRTWDWHITF